MKHNIHIYGLFDPRSPDVIMYVGKGGEKRPMHHWKFFLRNGQAVNALLRRWFERLRAEGVEPNWKFLEENVENWQESEREWIDLMRVVNLGLCNVADGGNAWPLRSCSLGGQIGGRENARRRGHNFFVRIGGLGDRFKKAKGGHRRKQLYPGMASEWGRLGGLALSGNLTDEARLKMSLAKKGKPSPRKGVVVGLETRQKMRTAALRRGSWVSKHARWHTNRGIVNPLCELCQKEVLLG